ncbi:acyltransferase [Chlorobium sp.]|uniref:acyltransferase family protein n=1 Tax=Chlorobium sp. TaxID=1095 RepID=UPI0025BC4523|nr:acyltransferase [Chlorobium sp.]MCF8271894.1 acyltransferase [Chlorobium sp.]MCF8291881.1 acyltransferase [Chlorobium sp.]MCF8385983.1 acyltransferase [Chlorobium sp.]
MATKHKKRNIPIDTLRGMACIMLVAYHVIGNTPQSGLKLHEGFLKEANELLAYIRMPLFTFLSGLVYGWRPYSGNRKTFINGKIRRLIVPMLVVGTIFALFQAFTPGTNYQTKEWHYLHILPVAHYWFIESLFIIFLGIMLLEQWKILDTKAGFAIIYIASAIACVANAGTPWFSIGGAFYLFPYFLAGLYCTRFPLQFDHSQTTGYVAITMVILFLILFGNQYGGERRSLNALIIGTTACIALLFTKAESPWLAAIGNYSYSIYLFHVFFTAASRIALMKIGIADTWLLFTAGTIAGVAGPILFERIAARHNASRLLFLGQSPMRRNALKPATQP